MADVTLLIRNVALGKDLIEKDSTIVNKFNYEQSLALFNIKMAKQAKQQRTESPFSYEVKRDAAVEFGLVLIKNIKAIKNFPLNEHIIVALEAINKAILKPNNPNIEILKYYDNYIAFLAKLDSLAGNELTQSLIQQIHSMMKTEFSYTGDLNAIEETNLRYRLNNIFSIVNSAPSEQIELFKVMKNFRGSANSSNKVLPSSKEGSPLFDRINKGFRNAFVFHEQNIDFFGREVKKGSPLFNLLNFLGYPRQNNGYETVLFFFLPTFLLMFAKNALKLVVQMSLFVIKELPHYVFDIAKHNYQQTSGFAKLGWGAASTVAGFFYGLTATPWLIARAIFSPIQSAKNSYADVYQVSGSKGLARAALTLSVLVTAAAYTIPFIFAAPIVGLLGLAGVPYIGVATTTMLTGLAKFAALLAPVANVSGVSGTVFAGAITGIAASLAAVAVNFGFKKLSAKQASAVPSDFNVQLLVPSPNNSTTDEEKEPYELGSSAHQMDFQHFETIPNLQNSDQEENVVGSTDSSPELSDSGSDREFINQSKSPSSSTVIIGSRLDIIPNGTVAQIAQALESQNLQLNGRQAKEAQQKPIPNNNNNNNNNNYNNYHNARK
ncbi:MAG: hypothetical protein H0W64_06425 [Gammaproteobacteria bacterium]|nr:hypothetical protein [Gammaproteobacteria bacterium]